MNFVRVRANNKRLLTDIVMMLVLGLVLAACAKPAPGPKPTPAPAPAPTSAPSPTPAPKPSPAPTTTAPAPPAKVYSWRLAVLYKEGDIRLDQLKQWVEGVRKGSQGAVNITVYPADTLVKTGDLPNALNQGLVEVAGAFSPLSYPGIVPVASFNQVFIPTDYRKYLVDTEILRILNKEAAAKINSIYIAYFSTGAQSFYLNKPFTSPEDMNGKLMRSSGGIMNDFITVWGGKVVTIPSPEVYTAAQRGTIEGANTSIISYDSGKLYEVFPYTLRSKMWETLPCPIAVNLNAWNNLPANLQKVLIDTAAGMILPFHDQNMKADTEILDKLSKQGLAKVAILSQALTDEWVKRVFPAFETQYKAAGPVGEEMLQYLKKTYWR